MSTRVVIGCTPTPGDYSFLLPLSALFWRDLVGYEPLLLLTGWPKDWTGPADVVMGALSDMNIRYRFLGDMAGFPPATLAQNCRPLAAALSFIGDDEWVMPSDADLWPLKRDFYHQHENATFDVSGLAMPYKAVLYYSNGDHFVSKQYTLERAAKGLRCQTLPMCHVVMKARDWRAIYQPFPDDITSSVKAVVSAWMDNRDPSDDKNFCLWMADQQIMTEALCAQPWFPRMAKFIERRGHPPVDRLDRSMPPDWMSFDPERWTDAHLLRVPWSEGAWQALRRIIDALMPSQSEFARSYHARYMEAIGC